MQQQHTEKEKKKKRSKINTLYISVEVVEFWLVSFFFSSIHFFCRIFFLIFKNNENKTNEFIWRLLLLMCDVFTVISNNSTIFLCTNQKCKKKQQSSKCLDSESQAKICILMFVWHPLKFIFFVSIYNWYTVRTMSQPSKRLFKILMKW